MSADAAEQLDDSRETGSSSDDISIRTGRNLRRLRTRHGYSLDRLAKAAGVSRAMIGQIETGKSSPTLTVLAKLAAALQISCGALIVEEDEPKVSVLTRTSLKALSSSDGKFETRALFPFEGNATAEFYELRIAPHHAERADAHRQGTVENLVVSTGTLEVVVGRQSPYILGEGDAIVFEADVPHVYRNMTGTPVVAYLVSTCR